MAFHTSVGLSIGCKDHSHTCQYPFRQGLVTFVRPFAKDSLGCPLFDWPENCAASFVAKQSPKHTLKTHWATMKSFRTHLHSNRNERRRRFPHLRMFPRISVLADCPAGYSVINDQFRSCYLFASRRLTWFEAELFCQSTRGHLVQLESQAEADFVVEKIRSRRGEIRVGTPRP